MVAAGLQLSVFLQLSQAALCHFFWSSTEPSQTCRGPRSERLFLGPARYESTAVICGLVRKTAYNYLYHNAHYVAFTHLGCDFAVLTRHIFARYFRLEDIRAVPLVHFALKALAAEEVAAMGAEAVTAAIEQRQRQLQEGKELQLDFSGSSAAQSYLLQLLTDLELVALVLDAEPPLSHPQEIPEILENLETLPQPVRRTVEAALGGQHSAEALKKVTREGRKALQPALVDTLE